MERRAARPPTLYDPTPVPTKHVRCVLAAGSGCLPSDVTLADARAARKHQVTAAAAAAACQRCLAGLGVCGGRVGVRGGAFRKSQKPSYFKQKRFQKSQILILFKRKMSPNVQTSTFV